MMGSPIATAIDYEPREHSAMSKCTTEIDIVPQRGGPVVRMGNVREVERSRCPSPSRPESQPDATAKLLSTRVYGQEVCRNHLPEPLRYGHRPVDFGRPPAG